MYQVLNYKDKQFPEKLKEIRPLVKNLYLKGNIDLINNDKTISIVGSRNISQYGVKVVKELIPKLVNAGVTIVSGFSTGVDTLVHELTLQNYGKTIAVMPCGIEYIYPRNNTVLHARIIEKDGLVISEYPGEFKTAKWTYVLRNRLVAALSPVTLVVEARVESGSLITAEYARKYNRKVCVIPCSVFAENRSGIISLIRQGGYLLESLDELIRLYNCNGVNAITKNKAQSANQLVFMPLAELSQDQNNIVDSINNGHKSINELQKVSKYELSKLLTILSGLQIANLIIEKEGFFYVNKG